MEMKNLKVLVCDDSILSRKKLKDCIIALGCSTVLEASDGEEAIIQFEKEKPDIVFMDIVMPKMDGIEALKVILHKNPNATIIMASSVGTQSYLKDAIKAGAKDFLQKPIDSERVESLINVYCKKGDQ